jgi:hypothetical protein
MEIKTNTGGEAVRHALAMLHTAPKVESRAGTTRELTAYTAVISDPWDTLAPHEDFRPGLAAAEALHLISGEPYGARIRGLTADLESRRWSESHLSYGVRLRDQMPVIAWKLERDPTTRQAVTNIWNEDLGCGTADFFCAVGIQFLLRDRLEMIVTMRSTDAWHGLPYNLFAFAQLQCTLARCLGVEPGRYTHQVGSLHLYERHWEKARKAVTDIPWSNTRVAGVGLALRMRDVQNAWLDAAQRASALLEGWMPSSASEDEKRLFDLLGA